MNIGVLGGGSFGIALSTHLARKGYGVRVWEIDSKRVDGINNGHHDLLDVDLPDNILASSELSVVQDCPIVLMAVPSQFVESTCRKVKKYLGEETVVVCCSKGFDPSGKLLFEVIEKVLDYPVAVLSGPSFAKEIIEGNLTGVTIAGSKKVTEELAEVFSSKTFYVEQSDDPRGVQLAAGFKNVLAIVTGIVSKEGHNGQTLLLTKGFHDLVHFVVSNGGKVETCYSLAGFGDVILTCTGSLSRNRQFGTLLGEGKSKKQALDEVGMVVEGVKALEIVKKLAKKKKLTLPTVDFLDGVLSGKDVDAMITKLLA